MTISKILAAAGLSAVLLCLGCTTSSTRPVQPVDIPTAPPEQSADPHYEPIIQRGPEYIDELRATPAPEQPEVSEGKNELGDQRELASQGYVRIGNGRYEAGNPESMRAAIALGRDVGADRIVLYLNHSAVDSAQEKQPVLAAYYVRFKLLFGATFRNLTAGERQRLGVENGVQIGSVVGGTPASQANLMAGDYVLGFDGAPVRDRSDFQAMLLEAAGQAVTLKVRRGQQSMSRIVRLGARPTSAEQP